MSYNLTTKDEETIKDFIIKYDSIYAEITKLETVIQDCLKKQGLYSEMLNTLREKEEEFFLGMSTASGEPVTILKAKATSFATALKSQETIS